MQCSAVLVQYSNYSVYKRRSDQMGQERRSAAKEAWSGVETEGGNGSRESGVGSREQPKR